MELSEKVIYVVTIFDLKRKNRQIHVKKILKNVESKKKNDKFYEYLIFFAWKDMFFTEKFPKMCIKKFKFKHNLFLTKK